MFGTSEITKRLDEIARRDAGLELFGAPEHRHYRCPPLEGRELAAFEASAGVRLPGEYREFLLHVSAGGVGPGYGLQWLGAALVPEIEDDELWAAEASKKMFPDRQRRAWCEANLSDAAPEPSVDDAWPEILPAAARPPVCKPVSERVNYVLTLSRSTRSLLSEQGVTRLREAFDVRDGLDAEPEISEIDWSSLGVADTDQLLERLWREHGFDRSAKGTLPICGYGHGIEALLVLHGESEGNVWMLDTENLVLEPFSEDWADLHGPDIAVSSRGCGFADWFSHWLECSESKLEALRD